MFQDINDWQPIYFSREQDIAQNFYVPVLKNAISFDIASAYFSSKALANCAVGIEYLALNNGKCRFILSREISEDDYLKIKQGYNIKEKINQGLIQDLAMELNIDDERKMSNLAYLIAQGLVEIKIAFMQTAGLFHHKFGVFRDLNGNIITSCGSNNYTEAANAINGESFHITCSWLCSPFDYRKITSNIEKFDNLWNNVDEEAIVLNIDDIVLKEIVKYNKGELIIDNAFMHKDCIILDFANGLIGYNKLFNMNEKFKAFMKIKLGLYTKSYDNSKIVFKDNLTYIKINKIIKAFQEKAPHINLQITENLKNYISQKELYIEDRRKLGMLLKQKDEKLAEKLNEYKSTLSKIMARPLKHEQLWDSFFMYSMKKSSNFSVPGSGKTAAALGVYAYLKEKGLIDRILVISPKNAFNSWIDEFNICFENIEKLNYFNVQNNSSHEIKRELLKYDWKKFNLLLFNYEAVENYKKEIKTIIADKTLLIFDEVHRVKGVDKHRATQALDISQDANYVITMTGTPIPNTYADIYNNLNILFPNEYEIHFGFSSQFLKNPSDFEKEDINAKIRPFFCRTSKDDLMVPRANDDNLINIDVDYKENQLFNIVFSKYSNNKFSLIVRILQLESAPKMLLEKIDFEEFKYILPENFEIEDLEYQDFSTDIETLIKAIDVSSKTKKCVELVEQLLKENKPVIIWTIFKHSIYNLERELKKLNIEPIVICGDTSNDDRTILANKFKKGGKQVLITNPHTLAESISLHESCHDAIYFEYSYNLVHLLQSKDRIHRLGLTDGQYTQYYFLNDIFDFNGIEYSLDKEIYERLKLKEGIMITAISNDTLETPPDVDEDINEIFTKLGI